MGLDNESDRMTDQPHADVQREAPEIVSQRRAAEESSRPQATGEGEHDTGTVTTPEVERTGAANAQIRIRDLRQTLDLLAGLQCILSSFHEEQRGRHAPDPLLDELRGIHGHGYNWESLSYQDGVGQRWSYIAASLEQLRTRLQKAHGSTSD